MPPTKRRQKWTISKTNSGQLRILGAIEQGKVEPGLTIHGLRHSVAHILREEGFDERTIAGALGQRIENMAGTIPVTPISAAR